MPTRDAAAIRERVRMAWASMPRDGRTLTKIARDLEIPRSTLYNWTAGTVTPPAEILPALAEAFGRDVSWFFGTEGDDDLPGGRIGGLVSELSVRLTELEDLLWPFLNGEPLPTDPSAVHTLERALGRRASESRPDRDAG